MDIDIVNMVLRLCAEQQTCLFEVPMLYDHCLEKRLCTNSKHVLASIKNYTDIFKISRDQNRIEFFMPFELCRNHCMENFSATNGQLCSNLHLCYDYFYTNACRRSLHCPSPHVLSEEHHRTILGTLFGLDLDALTKAFRTYCQLKKHLLNHNSSSSSSSRVAAPPPPPAVPPPPLINPSSLLNHSIGSSTPSSNGNNWRLGAIDISKSASWKSFSRSTSNAKTAPIRSTPISLTKVDQGLQLCWTPEKDIPNHFIEVIFSNEMKSQGGPIRMHQIYQHLGIAHVFYENSEISDRVVRHGPVNFQSFVFKSRLLQRTVDLRHVCFANMPAESDNLTLYIDMVSVPYTTHHLEYYQNDKQTIVVEYKEDIDFSKISSNVRNHPQCEGVSIKCFQLYLPETLLVEYDENYSDHDLKKFFQHQRIFHMKTFGSCAFVHFFSHDDLLKSIKTCWKNSIRVTPIYVDIFAPRHLQNFLQQQQQQQQPLQPQQQSFESNTFRPIPEPIIKEKPVIVTENDSINEPAAVVTSDPEPSIVDEIVEIESKPDTACQPSSDSKEEASSLPAPVEDESSTLVERPMESPVEPTDDVNGQQQDENHLNGTQDNETEASDDFHDLPSDFDDDDLLLDESLDTNGDFEFLRSAAKNFMSSLSDMEAASNETNTKDVPHSLLYGDDYTVMIKNRQFAMAFLDYMQFRVERQRNPEKFRLLPSLKKSINEKKQREQTPSPAPASASAPVIKPDLLAMIDSKSSKKKRHRRNKKKKPTTNNKTGVVEAEVKSVHHNDDEEDDDDDDEETSRHVLNDQGLNENTVSTQRLPHVYLDNDLKPCIVVAGEENGHDLSEHDDWQDIKAGGKTAPATKKPEKKNQTTPSSPAKERLNPLEKTKKTAPTTAPAPAPPVSPLDSNTVFIPVECHTFVHQPKQYEAFRLRLRRSFPSINVRFQLENHTITIEGNQKSNVEQCLHYLRSVSTSKRCIRIEFNQWPTTTINTIVRMQQSTAQVKLDPHADYNRIFRSVSRLIDFQLKQQFYQQQCISCRRSAKQFTISYLEFPADKSNPQGFPKLVQERVLQLVQTRFAYIAIALSADLLRTKRWAAFFKNIKEDKELNNTLLIRKINTIIQIYGLHAHVQKVQTLITKFLDANRYETDLIESEQAAGFYSLFKSDFEKMEKKDDLREAELHFIYRARRGILSFQCFQEKFESVRSCVEELRSQLPTLILPIKWPILSRYFSKSNELQKIAASSSCMITVEQRADQARPTNQSINVKIIGRSTGATNKAQQLIQEFERQKYSSRQIHHTDIHLLTDRDVESLQNQCQTKDVSCAIHQSANSIELEGFAEDFGDIEKFINDLCLTAARRISDELQLSPQWIYYESTTNRPTAFGETIKQQLESAFEKKQKGIVHFKDHTGVIRKFDLDKMMEIISSTNSSSTPTLVKIERRDLKNPQPFPLPVHWTPMTGPWERVFLAKRENPSEWKSNAEIQRLLKLPHMLPEAWVVEVFRVQNPRMYQQYMAHKQQLATRAPNGERTLFRLSQENLIDETCANGFNRSHTDTAFSAYGQGCHFYCKAIDIDRTATLLAQNCQSTPMMLQNPSNAKPSLRFLFVCKVFVGRYTRGDASMKTLPPGYDSAVNDLQSPEIFVTHHDAQVLPEYLLAYQSPLF